MKTVNKHYEKGAEDARAGFVSIIEKEVQSLSTCMERTLSRLASIDEAYESASGTMPSMSDVVQLKSDRLKYAYEIGQCNRFLEILGSPNAGYDE
jgi:hypothetical protein